MLENALATKKNILEGLKKSSQKCTRTYKYCISNNTRTHPHTDYQCLSAVVSRQPGCDVKSSAFGLYVKQIWSGAC